MVMYSAVVLSIFLVCHAKKNLLICHNRLAECLVRDNVKHVNEDVRLSLTIDELECWIKINREEN